MSQADPQVERDAGVWPDLKLLTRPVFPRIPAGRYQARSVELIAFSAFKRRNLRLDFDIFVGDATAGQVIGRVPMFMPLPSHRLSPTSRLARLFQLLGVPLRGDRIPLNLLRHRLWVVEVADTRRGANDDCQLPQSLRYSVVRAVVEHLA